VFGFFIRFVGMVLGAALALGTMVSMQLPLLHEASTFTASLGAVPATSTSTIAWPRVGSAALVIPSLGVQRTWHDTVVPIASLTKLMTAYVVLQKLPLSIGESGPCITMTSADVQYYDTIKAEGQSSAAVADGEVLCEATLLDGMLVHSANNFASILAEMTSGSTSDFVTQMNLAARALGLTHTHYADPAGYDARSVSTALEQGHLASILMQSSLVRAIVDQSSVTLPVAGTLGSFTPFVGVDNVVGVKSGRTDAAGGCDVMAMDFVLNGRTQLAYAVVLGARGGDLLGPAGDEALALEQSVLTSQQLLDLPTGTVVGTLGWGTRRSNLVLAAPLTLEWFSALHSANASLSVATEHAAVAPGQVVGWLSVDEGTVHRVAVTVARRVSPASLLERLR